MLYVVPWTNVFTPKGNFNPENKKSIPPLEKTKLRNSLAAYEGHDADKVSCSCTALRPHPYKELGSQRMHRLKVEEERLEGCRGRVFKKKSEKLVCIHVFSAYIREQIWPNVPRAILQLH